MDYPLKYPTVSEIIENHDRVIDESGGMHGIRDLDGLTGVIEFIQNDFYYPDLKEKLIHLIFSINKNHYFFDGNKRASIASGAIFLLKNGVNPSYVRWYIEQFEDIVVWLAENSIDKRGIDLAISCMFIRFMMLDKYLLPKTHREAKGKIRKILVNHKKSVEFDEKIKAGYFGSIAYYYAVIVERTFKDMKVYH